MSEPTIADIQKEITSLRGEIDGLRAHRATPAPSDPGMPDMGQVMRNRLKQNLTEQGKSAGITVASLVNQVRGSGGEGTAHNETTITNATDLPTDAQIAEKMARLALLVQNPLALRALRCLAEPHFADKEMRRTKADLAAALGAGETDVEAALTPLLDRYEVTWGKDASGQEYYAWSGNGFAMTLLILG